MHAIIKIGTRDSELAVWQATLVKNLLAENGYESSLVFIKSEGDIDLQTPLYEMGVQGIFTRSLDIALLNNSIDIAVHSMKDVPTQLPLGIAQAAVLKRGNYKDLFVINQSISQLLKDNDTNSSLLQKFEDFIGSLNASGSLPSNFGHSPIFIASSSIRRKAQWLNRYPGHRIDNLRGNINNRMNTVMHSNWHGAVFAAAGLERINLRPADAVELDWMLPSPAQGAIIIVCKENNLTVLKACAPLNDETTAYCTKMERDFLRELLGGCAAPISALVEVHDDKVYFKGNILSIEGKEKVEIEKSSFLRNSKDLGRQMAKEILKNGGQKILNAIRNK